MIAHDHDKTYPFTFMHQHKHSSRHIIVSITIFLIRYVVCTLNYSNSALDNIRQMLCLVEVGSVPCLSPYIHRSQVERSTASLSTLYCMQVGMRVIFISTTTVNHHSPSLLSKKPESSPPKQLEECATPTPALMN